MRVNLFATLKHAMLASSILLAACTTDLYEEKPEPEPNPTPGPESPVGDIVNSTTKARNLTVNVQDAYDGKYYYTVEVFMGNPATDENARLIAGQKTNSKVPFSLDVNIPDTESDVYILQTDPFKRKRVYAFPVQEGNMICDLGVSNTTKSATKSMLRSDDAPAVPEIDFSVPAGAISISGTTRLQTGKTYIVEQGQTLTIGSSLPGEGNFNLYVKGTVILSVDNLSLQQSAKIYILDGGEWVASKNNILLRCVGTAQIAIEKGGFLGDDDDNKSKLSLSFTDQSKLVNYGEIELTGKKANSSYSLSMTASASVYNRGKMDVDGGLSATDATNRIVNYGNFEIGNTLTLTNGEIYNACEFDTDICKINGGTIRLASGSIFEADKFTAGGLKMYMDALSIFECTDDKKSAGVHFESQTNYISGTSNSKDYALFKADKVIGTWNSVVYSGMVEIECDDHEKDKNYYELKHPATFAKGQASVEIPSDDCNANSGNNNPGTGGGDTDDEYEEVETLSYTYLFEDNWPAVGDYDMNDLVIGIQVTNKKKGEQTLSAKIAYKLYAAGATKQIGAAFQLDGVEANAVVGAEAGQSKAVFPLFTDAHAALGSSGRIPINTDKLTVLPATGEVIVVFNSPSNKSVKPGDINLFIVTESLEANPRTEIHVAGFKGTDKASKSELSYDNYVSVETGLMWGLYIPSAQFATYPKEYVKISDAYEGFDKWIKGDQTPGWYLNFEEKKVVKYDLAVIP